MMMPTLAYSVGEETGYILFGSCSMYNSSSPKKYGMDVSVVKCFLFCSGCLRPLSNFRQVIIEIFTVVLAQI
jgi:hypothetical protein